MYLPYALARKYRNADKMLNRQYVFPSGRLSKDPRSNVLWRHHVGPGRVNKAIKVAVKK